MDAQLKEIVERCMQRKPVLDRHGKPCGEWKFDGKNANQALHLMGKDRGMFVEKVEINQADAALAGKTDKEVQATIKQWFIDIGRYNCIWLMEEAFEIKIEFESNLLRSRLAETSKEPTTEPDSTVH